MTVLDVSPSARERPARVSFLWLEITGRCQLTCQHCYASSGPSGTHGTMTVADWARVVDQAAAAGCRTVQFIGGEPTLHPALPDLIGRALDAGMAVEVFSNLVGISVGLWETLTCEGVSLACSYYSDDADEHAAITGRASAHARTRANIAEALRRGVDLRVGVVDVLDSQRTAQAVAELEALGVLEISTDRLRGVGRAAPSSCDPAQLCGHCTRDVLAVGPDGWVTPCVFSRWLGVGDLRTASLAEILSGPNLRRTRAELDEAFLASRESEIGMTPCVPKMCNPQCGPSCSPACMPAGTCGPAGRCVPNTY